MSKYYPNYSLYLGAQKCCDQGPTGPMGPTGPSTIGPMGYTGPTGPSVTGPTGRSCKGDTGPTGPSGISICSSIIGGSAENSITLLPSYFGAYTASYNLNTTLVENECITVIPLDCTLSNLYINLNVAPGIDIDKFYSFIVRKNGTDTSLVVTISGINVSGSNLLNTCDFSAGDVLTIKCVPIGSPSQMSLRWTCKILSRN